MFVHMWTTASSLSNKSHVLLQTTSFKIQICIVIMLVISTHSVGVFVVLSKMAKHWSHGRAHVPTILPSPQKHPQRQKTDVQSHLAAIETNI